MLITLLSPCKTGWFFESLDFNYEGRVKYVSLNNRACQVRPVFININSNEPLY